MINFRKNLMTGTKHLVLLMLINEKNKSQMFNILTFYLHDINILIINLEIGHFK